MSKPLRPWAALVVALGLAIMTGTAHRAAAQIDASVRISPPATESFPTVSFLLSVSDGSGQRVANLSPSNLRVIEDGSLRSAVSAEETEVGTRQLFVINSNQGMAVRDTRGRSRYQFVQTTLLNWWSAPNAARYGIDDLTLIDGDGPIVEHSLSAASLAAALDNHQPTFVSGQSGLRLLLSSMNALESAPSAEGSPAFALFFTSLIRNPEQLVLTNVIDRAQQLGVVIYPVLIDVADAAEDDAYPTLVQLAQSTNGQVYQLDPADPSLAPLQNRLLDQRTQYRVAYDSQIDRSGDHQLQVRVSGRGVTADSNVVSFSVSVSPADVTFVQPPLAIERAADDPTVPVEAMPPTEQPIELLITFPDGHPRPLASSRLLADGEVIAERVEEPFDRFDWDLTGLRQDQQVELQAEVTDELGITGRTATHAVDVTVVPPPGGLAALRPALGPLALVLGVLAAGVIAAVAFLTYGQRRRSAQAQPQARTPGPRPLERPRLRQGAAGPPEARLVPVAEDGEDLPWLPLTGADISLGSDASLAAYPLADGSVSGLHARLIRQAGGRYLLRDQGSVAGTWVNFEPVPEEGKRLEHGDLIQLGRVTLRFELSNPVRHPAIRVVPLAGSSADHPPDQETS
jgi:hypothetical protein